MNMDQIVVQRTHDQLYLSENRHQDPKELFKFIMNRVTRDNQFLDDKSICDYGCAAGEFLYYVNTLLPNVKISGIDILPELIEKARNFVPSATLKVGSVLEVNKGQENSFDVGFLIGVHSIFDEFETAFSNIISWTKPDGKVYISGMFNPFPLDILVKYRSSEDYSRNVFESGWNIFSQESVAAYLRKIPKVKSFSFEKFEISIDLPRQDDPVRSWTIQTKDDSRHIVNGLQIIQPHYLLEICL